VLSCLLNHVQMCSISQYNWYTCAFDLTQHVNTRHFQSELQIVAYALDRCLFVRLLSLFHSAAAGGMQSVQMMMTHVTHYIMMRAVNIYPIPSSRIYCPWV
jgi:hypothetical protein